MIFYASLAITIIRDTLRGLGNSTKCHKNFLYAYNFFKCICKWKILFDSKIMLTKMLAKINIVNLSNSVFQNWKFQNMTTY